MDFGTIITLLCEIKVGAAADDQGAKKIMLQATSLSDYQSTVFVKVSETEIIEMIYENYLLTYWRDHGALSQDIKEVEPDDIEGDVIYRVVTRYRAGNKIHSTDDFWTREEAELMILKGLEIECQNANNHTPLAFFSREEAIA